MAKVQKCNKCGSLLVSVGFERRLITRGKNKGQSTVREFLACPKNCVPAG